MEPVATIITRIQSATPLDLDAVLETINWQAFQENGWNLLSVKESYTVLLAGIDDALSQYQKCRDSGKDNGDVRDFRAEVQRLSERQSAVAKLQRARLFFQNPPVVENPNPKGLPVHVDAIDWSKPVYTANEVKILFGLSDSSFRRWLNSGWIAYTQMDGSDKKFFQREHLLAFLNNPKIHYPSTK